MIKGAIRFILVAALATTLTLSYWHVVGHPKADESTLVAESRAKPHSPPMDEPATDALPPAMMPVASNYLPPSPQLELPSFEPQAPEFPPLLPEVPEASSGRLPPLLPGKMKMSENYQDTRASAATGHLPPSDDVAWCRNAKKKYKVSPGKSWGGLKGQPRVEWGSRGCDTVLSTGRAFSCDDVWGESYVRSWRQSSRNICRSEDSTSGSSVRCHS